MKREAVLQKITKIIFAIIFIAIFIALIFNNNFDYSSKENLNTPITMLVALLVVIVSYFIFKKNDKEIKNIKYILIISSFVLFVLQLFITCNIYFETGWDMQVVFDDALLLSNQKKYLIDYLYYDIHPNNLFILFYLAFISKLCQLINYSNVLYAAIVIDCLISNITCLLVYAVSKKFVKNKYALLSYYFCVILIGLSPWNNIPYTDSVALFIPILIIHLYLNLKNNYLKYSLIALFSFVGYSLKPQSIIVTIAIIIYEIFLIKRKDFLKKTIILLMSVFIFLGCNFLFENYYTEIGFDLDEEKALGIAHYFMMGVNEETYGEYSQDDNDFSIYAYCKEERDDLNLGKALYRIEKMGLFGYLDFLNKKLTVTYDNGTYSWGKEGEFYLTIYDGTKISNFLRDIFYNDGQYFSVYAHIVHGFWLIVLLLCLKLSFLCKKMPKGIYILMLTIIGVTIFQLLFETRSRYLYANVPLFIVLGSYAYYNILNSGVEL